MECGRKGGREWGIQRAIEPEIDLEEVRVPVSFIISLSSCFLVAILAGLEQE